MSKRLTALALVMLMLLGLTACTNDSHETEPTATTATTEASVPPTYPGVVYNPEGNDGNLDSDDIDEEVQTYPTEIVSTQPTESNNGSAAVEPTESSADSGTTQITDYERFEAMSADEQAAFVETFDSALDFIEWYNNAEAEYQSLHPVIEIDGSAIDAEEILEIIE